MSTIQDAAHLAPPSLSAEPLLVSVVEAAQRLGVGRTSLYGLLSSGELSAVRVGRRRLIAVADLVSYVDRIRGQQGGKP